MPPLRPPAVWLATLLPACNLASPASSITSSDLSCTTEEGASPTTTVDEALADNTSDHEDPDDYVWDESTATTIELQGDRVRIDGSGASADGGVVTISSPGAYVVSGSLDDGQLIVDSDDEGLVQLVLADASIISSFDSAIRIDQASAAVLILPAGTDNRVADGAGYPSEAEQDAAIWSDDDLSIGGTGVLTVIASFEDGIASKDGLVIRGAQIQVSAPDDGIRGKDYLVVHGGSIDVQAGGDGLTSTEEGEPDLGYVLITEGTIVVEADGDAVSGETDTLLTGGTLTLVSGGGASMSSGDTTSTKGLKAGVLLVIDGGELFIDAADDAIHADGDVVVNGGTIELATADDGIHAELGLTVNGGDIAVVESYEGLEAVTGDLIVNGGTIEVHATDDGFNLSGDGDDPPGEETEGDPYDMAFNGGLVTISAGNDGIDSNGYIVMTGGCLIINGPVPGTHPEQGAIDYNGDFEVSGGLLVATGAAGRMAQAPSSSSTQPSVAVSFSSALDAGTAIALQTDAGSLAFAPTKTFQHVVISTEWLSVGDEVDLYLGEVVVGDTVDGVSDGGTIEGGTLLESFTVSSTVTEVRL